MPVIRLFLLLVVLGALILVLTQNWSPVLPLVFLGITTQALPLAMWMLLSVGAGIFSCLFLSSLFRLVSLAPRGKKQSRNVKASPPRASAPRPRPDTQYTTKTQPAAQVVEPTSTDVIDDWESNSNNDDWGFEQEPAPPAYQPQAGVKDAPGSDNQPNQGRGVYSYGSQQPSNSGVGKSESIYDANYRVITPPFQPTERSQDDDDDWGFDDDEVEDEPKDDHRPRRS